MSSENFTQELLEFLRDSPTPFHAVGNLSAMFASAGFIALDESEQWNLEKGGRYFVSRNDSACIAFKTGQSEILASGIHLAGTHTDSPCLKVKPNPDIESNGYSQIGVEVYGGALLHPWFDRDLSLAGRVEYRAENGSLKSSLLDMKEPVAFIPSLAIHLDRKANEGRNIKKQTELSPILLQREGDESFVFDDFLLSCLQQQENSQDAVKILSHELSLYDSQAPQLVGLEKQFIAGARLDNLLSCFLAARSLLDSNDDHCSMLVCNDHEEVGSVSSSGAQGPFLKSVVERVIKAEAHEADAVERVMRQSTLLSVDNAHGVHPNFADKHDDKHPPQLNGGPVIKINANQRYASSSKSIALFKTLCDSLDIPYQSFVMRNDMACGSTIGPITSASLGISTIDVGIATFGMHSLRELAGVEDPLALSSVIANFFSR